MSDHARTLIDLLDGDLVRLRTPERTIQAEVIDHQRELHDSGEGWHYTIRFMPVGEDATEVSADRFRVEVAPDGEDWTVSELVAEVYVESELSYEPEPRGPITGVEVLGRP